MISEFVAVKDCISELISLLCINPKLREHTAFIPQFSDPQFEYLSSFSQLFAPTIECLRLLEQTKFPSQSLILLLVSLLEALTKKLIEEHQTVRLSFLPSFVNRLLE